MPPKKQRTPHERHAAKLAQAVFDRVSGKGSQPYFKFLDSYMKKWLYAAPGVSVFFSLHGLAFDRLRPEEEPELDGEDQELAEAIEADKNDEDPNTTLSTTTAADNTLWEKLMKTLNPFPEFPLERTLALVDEIDEAAFVQILDILRKQIRQGRSNDIRTMRRLAPEIILHRKSDRLKEMFTSTGPRSERGFSNYDCARMLVPLKQLEQFDRNPEAFMKGVTEGVDPQYHWKAQFWCTFLYPPNTRYAPGKVNGLFEGYMIIRALRIVYFGPGTAFNSSGPITQPPKAAKHRISEIEAHHVGYVAVLIVVSLSSAAQYKPRIGRFSLRKFYDNIVAFLSSDHPKVKKVLKKLNDEMPWERLKYDTHSDGDEEADHPDSVANLLADDSDDDSESSSEPLRPPETSSSSESDDDGRQTSDTPEHGSPPVQPPPEIPVVGRTNDERNQQGPTDTAQPPQRPQEQPHPPEDVDSSHKEPPKDANANSQNPAASSNSAADLFDDDDDADDDLSAQQLLLSLPNTPLRPSLKRGSQVIDSDNEETDNEHEIPVVQRRRIREKRPMPPPSTRPTRSNTIIPKGPFADPPATVSRRKTKQTS